MQCFLFTHIPTLELQPPAPLIPTHLGPHTVSVNIAKPLCTAGTGKQDKSHQATIPLTYINFKFIFTRFSVPRQ